ncbi:MAG: hypothetical protein VYC70_07940 [Verrucomicrobiota bacterium]|nr:hypothetical protein [Verrucomicrobiota bacterium]
MNRSLMAEVFFIGSARGNKSAKEAFMQFTRSLQITTNQGAGLNVPNNNFCTCGNKFCCFGFG